MGKQVKTPRFYVDMPTFLHATGQLGWDDIHGGAELLYMNCANPYTDTRVNTDVQSTLFKIGSSTNNTPKTSFPINFCALLNHNLAEETNDYQLIAQAGLTAHDGLYPNLTQYTGYAVKNVLNTSGNTPTISSTYNGTSIWTFTDSADGSAIDNYWREFSVYFPNGLTGYKYQLGSMVVGKYFDCPNSPDLNLTMSRRFDGIKSQKTIGGKTLSNIYYDGPTEWTISSPRGTYKYPPFELDFPDTYSDDSIMQQSQFEQSAKSGLGRKGLRSWKLSFSYISEDNMWMAYENSSRAPFDYVETGTNATTGTEIPTDDGEEVSFVANPMLSDNSFNFVWNCTLGGTLPFIFQPDNTNNNTDQFAICTFRENTFSVDQIANNVYNVSMTIDELA